MLTVYTTKRHYSTSPIATIPAHTDLSYLALNTLDSLHDQNLLVLTAQLGIGQPSLDLVVHLSI